MQVPAADTLAAMAELERNTPDQVKQLRSDTRISVRAKVTARPANSSGRNSFQCDGVLGDISRGGCLVLFPTPLRVGDIYRLSFDRKVLNLNAIFARCLRCRLIREDAFEAGFSFFQSIDLTGLDVRRPSDLLD